MEIYNESQVFKDVYVEGDVTITNNFTTNIDLSCLVSPQNSNVNGFVLKRNGNFIVGSIENTLKGIQADHTIHNIANAPYLCVLAELKNPIPVSNFFRHTIDYIIPSGDFFVQCNAFNILNEPVVACGAVVNNNINIYSSSSLDLTATIVLYKK